MPRSALPILLALVVAVVGWYVLRPRGPADDGVVDLGARRDPSGPTVERSPLTAPSLVPGMPVGAPTPVEPTWPVVPTDRIPRGNLEVALFGPDLQPLPPDADVFLRLERDPPFWAEPLAVVDPETKLPTFTDVPFGRVTVHAWGDHFVHVAKEADVPKDRTERVEIYLDRGGAIHYVALLRDDTQPASVTLRLLSARSKQPVAAHFQTRKATQLTTDVRATEATLGGEGLLFAVPPGRYVIEATSAEGAETSKEVEVRVGETTDVELYFAY